MDNTERLRLKNHLFQNIPFGLALTGRVKNWGDELLPVSCTVFDVKDSMEGKDGIEDSWHFTSHGLRKAAGVAINLNNLRPAGTDNGRGLVSSGAVSFMSIYSKLNEILRRGGIFKNGACLSGDTLVNTSEGLIPIKDLVGTPFVAVVHGKPFPSSPEGFWSSGVKPVFHILLDNGMAIDATLDHSFLRLPPSTNPNKPPKTIWTSVRYLNTGDELVLDSPENELLSSPISDIFFKGEMKVYDCTIPELHYFVANGIIAHNCTVYLDYDHPDASAFIDANPHDNAWIKLAMYVDEGLKTHPIKAKLAEAVDKGTVWLAKKQWDDSGFRLFSNVCVTGDTTVLTTDGVKTVDDLIGVPFNAIVDGKVYPSAPAKVILDGENVGELSDSGFFHTGDFPVYKLETIEGYSITLTSNHKVYTENGWRQVKHLMYGDAISLNNHRSYVETLSISSPMYTKDNLPFTYTDGYTLGSKIGYFSQLPSDIESYPYPFLRGFVLGLYSKKGRTRRFIFPGNRPHFSNLDVSILEIVQRILLRFGILSVIRSNSLYIDPSHNNQALFQDYFLLGNCFLKIYSPESNSESNSEQLFATFKSLTYVGVKPVYDCSIPIAHSFDGNGFIVHNCLEILLKSRATCLISNINLGLLQPKQLPLAFTQGAEWLAQLHPLTGVGETGHYLPPEVDRQIGLGVIGLASFLAINGISYSDFVDALLFVEDATSGFRYDILEAYYPYFDSHPFPRSTAFYLAWAYHKAAAEVGRQYNFERIFTVAPTATSFTKHFDAQGYSITPEISPPLGRSIERTSETFGSQLFHFHPNVEIASDVGWNTQWLLLNVWQRLMNSTGLAHSISANIWDTCPVDESFIDSFLDSDLKTTYYRLSTLQASNDKSSIISDSALHSLAYSSTSSDLSDLDFNSLFDLDSPPSSDSSPVICSLDSQYCESCGGD